MLLSAAMLITTLHATRNFDHYSQIYKQRPYGHSTRTVNILSLPSFSSIAGEEEVR